MFKNSKFRCLKNVFLVYIRFEFLIDLSIACVQMIMYNCLNCTIKCTWLVDQNPDSQGNCQSLHNF